MPLRELVNEIGFRIDISSLTQAERAGDRISGNITDSFRDMGADVDRIINNIDDSINHIHDPDVDTIEMRGQLELARREIENLRDALNQAENNMDDLNDRARETSRDIGGLNIGSLLGAGATGKALGFMSEVDASAGKIQAQLNITRKEAEELRKIAGDIFADNFASSVGEASAGLVMLRQVTKLEGNELKNTTEDVFRITDAFDQDFREVVDAARANSNAMGTSFEDSLNMITTGFQRGANISDDFLDTVREYSPLFKQAGKDSGEMLYILGQGLEAGARDTDQIADGFKEFGNIVRQTDSQPILDLTSAMGLNVTQSQKLADSWRNEFAKGGQDAENAANEIIKSLYSIDDPLKRNQLGVGLFGALWEDTAGKIGTVLLDAQGKTIELANTTSTLDNQYDSATSKIQGFGRSLLGDFMGPLEQMGPTVQLGIQGLTSLGMTILGLSGLGITFSGVMGAATTVLGAFGTVMGVILSPIGLVIAVVAALGYGAYELYQHWDEAKTFMLDIFDSIELGAKGFANGVIGAVNRVISAINSVHFNVPDWVPGIGGEHFGLNLSQIPMLAKGTDYFQGGLAIVGEKGPEFVNLPRGAQVIPHNESMSMINQSKSIIDKEFGLNIPMPKTEPTIAGGGGAPNINMTFYYNGSGGDQEYRRFLQMAEREFKPKVKSWVEEVFADARRKRGNTTVR